MTKLLKKITTLICALLALTSLAQQSDEGFVLVIDPGHGGKDGGCEGALTNERTIVLDVAKRVEAMIADSLPDVKVILTRSDNRYITLQERAAIANRANGNLFVSVHVNSVDKRNKNRRNIHGASVYVLGLHKTENNLSVAMRENSVMQLEDDYTQAYQGFDPTSSESYIIFELSQNNHLNKSIEFANAVQQELITTSGRADKGVRQAGFWVLWATSMPSVLIELDYICNPEAEKFLHSGQGKENMAQSIFNAFASYYAKHRADTHGPRVGKTAPVAQTFTSETKNGENTAANKKNDRKASKSDKANNGMPLYHVQILTARKKIPTNDTEIKGVPDVNFVHEGKFYKYYSGTFTNQTDAKEHLKKLRKRFPKAFVIKTKDGKIL